MPTGQTLADTGVVVVLAPWDLTCVGPSAPVPGSGGTPTPAAAWAPSWVLSTKPEWVSCPCRVGSARDEVQVAPAPIYRSQDGVGDGRTPGPPRRPPGLGPHWTGPVRASCPSRGAYRARPPTTVGLCSTGVGPCMFPPVPCGTRPAWTRPRGAWGTRAHSFPKPSVLRQRHVPLAQSTGQRCDAGLLGPRPRCGPCWLLLEAPGGPCFLPFLASGDAASSVTAPPPPPLPGHPSALRTRDDTGLTWATQQNPGQEFPEKKSSKTQAAGELHPHPGGQVCAPCWRVSGGFQGALASGLWTRGSNPRAGHFCGPGRPPADWGFQGLPIQAPTNSKPIAQTVVREGPGSQGDEP